MRFINNITVIIVIIVIMFSMLSPSVLAAETTTVDGWIRIDPDTDNMTVNMSWNASDPTNTYLFNWNQTVEPFETNNSITGSFTGTFLPPIEFQVVEGVGNLTLLGLVKFKSTWIMSGSTESWWRVPCQGPSFGNGTNLTLWHIDSPATLDVETDGSPNNISHPIKIFDQDFNMNATSLNDTVRYWNGTAWNRSFNSTWVRVLAQIHTDEFYLVRWVINISSGPYLIRFSSTDQCEDRVFKTWVIHENGTKEIYEADIDYSVLHIHGMGHAVWGNEILLNNTIVEYDSFDDTDGTDLQVHNSYWDYYSEGGSSSNEIETDVLFKTNGTLKSYRDGSNSPLFGSNLDVTASRISIEWYFTSDTGIGLNSRFYVYSVGPQLIVYFRLYESSVRVYWGNGVGGASYNTKGFTGGEWCHVRVEMDFDNNRQRVFFAENNGTLIGLDPPGGSPDYGDGWGNFYLDYSANGIDYFMYIFQGGTGNTRYDEFYLNYTTPVEIIFDTELDDPINEWDYLTALVPFMDVVNNGTNVLINISTLNDTWSNEFWVAYNGPTDFGIKSFQWDQIWTATQFRIKMTFYNLSRTIFIMDHNPEFHPDRTWQFNRYTINYHDWAPSDYYFGGIPYHSLQVTNGSWENTNPTGSYYLQGRLVDPDQIMKKRQDSDNWLIEIVMTGYEGVARVTAAIAFAVTGQFDRAWDVLDPNTPFPLDAPWYLGKFYFKALNFLTGLGGAIWSGLVWLYETGQWIVNAAGWVFAGVMTLLVLLVIPPIWARFFKIIWGLIKFGWTLAQDGPMKAAEFANAFWKELVETSYVKRVARRIPRRGGTS